jgi:5-methylcytosine-specific restriction endonuclease McrA
MTRQTSSGEPWGQKEDAVVLEYYAIETLKEVAARLPDRTWHAVGARARKLGLRKGTSFTRGRWKPENRGYRVYRDSVKWGHYRNENNGRPSWSLSKKVFLSLVRRACHYCGAPPQRREVSESSTDKRFVIFASGLDRIDASGPYSADNVVPCCTTCNVAKSDMTVGEFREWVKRIHEHFVAGEQDAE